MSLLDSILGQVGQGGDIAGIAERLGLDRSLVEKAVSGLAAVHAQPGDTVDAAAAKTGIESGVLGAVLQQLGGAGALGSITDALASNPQAAGLLKMFDRDGDGNPVNDILGMASGLFGKKD